VISQGGDEKTKHGRPVVVFSNLFRQTGVFSQGSGLEV